VKVIPSNIFNKISILVPISALVEGRQQPYVQRLLPELAKLLSFNVGQFLIPWNMLPKVREHLSSLQCLYLESDVVEHVGKAFTTLVSSQATHNRNKPTTTIGDSTILAQSEDMKYRFGAVLMIAVSTKVRRSY
jgi:hypothetical protein